MGASGTTTDDAIPDTARAADAQRSGTRATRPRGPRIPARLRTPKAPRLWFEIALIGISYWTYSLVRNAVPEQRAQALLNAQRIWEFEQLLGIAVEQGVNRAVNGVTWLIVGMNYYYATLHFVVTVCVLAWLYRRHPGRYAAARLALFAATAGALLGYYLYPLAPPRLMTGVPFVDTVKVHDTWGSMASGNLAEMSNQYAAMPSIHIGWSVWCGATMAVLAKPRWIRVTAVLYPVLTLVVIVCTANHFWLDAAGGLVCLAAGHGVARAWYGCPLHRLPRGVRSARNTPPRRRTPPAPRRRPGGLPGAGRPELPFRSGGYRTGSAGAAHPPREE